MQEASNWFEEVIARRTSRRKLLQWGALTTLAVTAASFSSKLQAGTALAGKTNLTANRSAEVDFTSVARDYTAGHAVAQGYEVEVIARWGDPLDAETAAFDPHTLNAKTQEKRFGYNNDFIAYLPFTKGAQNSSHGLLHVNHEYTDNYLMFPGLNQESANKDITADQIRVEMAAQGFSILEIKRDHAGWRQVLGSEFSRRVTATTPIRISGPAAGSPRLRTLADPEGKTVLGTFANCSGGVTPWGTVLVSEENFDGYFYGKTVMPEQASHERYTIGKETLYAWHRVDPRFYVAREPNEPNRFGWVVEYDPYDPKSQPVKRTALGRFKHETATCALVKDGRVVVYSGDDDYFEYIYRFVSKGKAGKDALDNGELQVARFHEDGSLEWLPLVFGENDLTPENGFDSQADVLIEARRAADKRGATKMDRPEGIAIHPKTQAVYISLTKNPKRERPDAANPRPQNRGGHIVVLFPPEGNHAAKRYQWDIFLLAGDPESDAPDYGKRPKKNDWFGNPDNLAIDPQGRLWVATDGMPEAYGCANGLYAMVTEGENAAAPRCFFRAPRGAEVTGPCFTPDGETLFLSVQHPGEEEGSNFQNPSTRWPDFNENMPPRPAVLAFTRKKGGKIGG